MRLDAFDRLWDHIDESDELSKYLYDTNQENWQTLSDLIKDNYIILGLLEASSSDYHQLRQEALKAYNK